MAGLALAVVVLWLWGRIFGRKAQLPPLVAFCGPPGVGKSYCMARWMTRQMAAGRLGLSQFAVDGAVPLVHMTDLLHEMAGGAAISLDEAGRIFPARDWRQEDDLEQLWIETIRHYGQTCVFACHSPADVGVHVRRRVGLWIQVERIGPDPSIMLRNGKQPKRRERPQGFRLTAYAGGGPPDHMPAMTKPQILWREKIPFQEQYASRYDTGERIWTDAQETEIRSRLEGAEERLTAAPWRVSNGMLQSAQVRLQRGRDRDRKADAKQRAGGLVAGLSLDDLDAMAAALDEAPALP